MGDHHAVDFVGKVAEHREFVLLHCLPRSVNHGKLVMGVESCGGIAGKVFAATEHSGGAQAFIEGARLLDNFCRGAPVAAPSQGVIGFVVEGDVENRAEIEIEAEEAKQAPGDVAMPANLREVAFVAELLGIRRFVANKFADAKRGRLPDRS